MTATKTATIGTYGKMALSITSKENKMSDGGRDRASLGVEVWKSS
jgi:hypothetical protein